MERARHIPRLLRGKEVDCLRGHGRTKRYEDIAAGVLVRPIARGVRDKRYPEDEIQALIAAEIRGESVEQRRAHVERLMTARVSG